MHMHLQRHVIAGVLFALPGSSAAPALAADAPTGWGKNHDYAVQLGPRPLFLVDQLKDEALKAKLRQCIGGPFRPSTFSIGHRGAAMQFPEHTRQSYIAGAQMGAGILECDVAFTKDKQLVCRHSQCDLHTTTNILAIPELAAKCTQPFTPADPATGQKASAMCCTSDVDLAEFKALQGKMDAFNADAKTAAEYMDGTANWRTDLYATAGTLMTHAESIELFKELGTKFTPELKTPSVTMPYEDNYTQEAYAQQMIDEYKKAGVSPSDVFPQSFRLDDVLYWIKAEPEFGKQAVFLDETLEKPADVEAAIKRMPELYAKGVRYYAPPLFALVTVGDNGRMAASPLAKAAKAAGLKLITWSLERSGPLKTGGGWYYTGLERIINNDGQILELLDVLANDAGVVGVFSDWPATTTYYANCTGR
jgi:glycerophosphoryl diester phosphodiesterase